MTSQNVADVVEHVVGTYRHSIVPAVTGAMREQHAEHLAAAIRMSLRDPRAMQHLHHTTRGISRDSSLSDLLPQLLDSALALTDADFGNIQLVDPATGALRLATYAGFNSRFLDYFAVVSLRYAYVSHRPEPERAMPACVRYIVADVDAAIDFYTRHLGFTVQMHPAPAFAEITRDDLHLYLTQPGPGGGGAPMPSGEAQTPGGWNRIHLIVSDLDATIATLRAAACQFRNAVVQGVGGKQILLEDPSGNLVELFEPNTAAYRAPGQTTSR